MSESTRSDSTSDHPDDSPATQKPHEYGFGIFINTVCEGRVPSVRGDGSKPFVFPTRIEAECEIADLMMTRLQEFLDGERDFEDAMTLEEYIMEVDMQPDGSVTTEDGDSFE